MTYYLLQKRFAKQITTSQPNFPAIFDAMIRFGPEDAFGVRNDNAPRTTSRKSQETTIIWNTNDGCFYLKEGYIDPLNSTFNIDKFRSKWSGNILHLSCTIDSIDEASSIATSLNAFLPALLSFYLHTFVWIKEFMIKIGQSEFRVEIESLRYNFAIATTQHNQTRVNDSIRDWILLKHENLRIVLAMHYYRHAQRLQALDPDRQTMAAEVILNLTKALEILFTDDRETLRQRAQTWKLRPEFIESRIIPLGLIRNTLDVAHVSSSPMPSEDLQLLLNFITLAMNAVHDVLSHVTRLAYAGCIQLDPVSQDLDKDKIELISKIREYVNATDNP